MYYIYHILGVKIGCSMYPKRRVKTQGYTDFEILAESNDKFEAGNLEVQFQKQYGYKIDRVKYYQANYKSMGHKGGARNVELGNTEKLQKIGSKIAASLPRTEAQLESSRKTQKIAAQVAWALPRTQKQIDAAKYKRTEKHLEVLRLNGKIQGKINAEKSSVSITAFSKKTKELVGVYKSINECARQLGLRQSDITHCLNPKKQQHSTKGYTFIKNN